MFTASLFSSSGLFQIIKSPPVLILQELPHHTVVLPRAPTSYTTSPVVLPRAPTSYTTSPVVLPWAPSPILQELPHRTLPHQSSYHELPAPSYKSSHIVHYLTSRPTMSSRSRPARAPTSYTTSPVVLPWAPGPILQELPRPTLPHQSSSNASHLVEELPGCDQRNSCICDTKNRCICELQNFCVCAWSSWKSMNVNAHICMSYKLSLHACTLYIGLLRVTS